MDSSSKVNFEISLQQLIEKLHILFSEDHVNADEVQQLMQTYQSKYSDWKKYANFDPHRYVLSGQKQLFTCRFYFKNIPVWPCVSQCMTEAKVFGPYREGSILCCKQFGNFLVREVNVTPQVKVGFFVPFRSDKFLQQLHQLQLSRALFILFLRYQISASVQCFTYVKLISLFQHCACQNLFKLAVRTL